LLDSITFPTGLGWCCWLVLAFRLCVWYNHNSPLAWDSGGVKTGQTRTAAAILHGSLEACFIRNVVFRAAITGGGR
jgi:hypothetical protein